MKFKHGNNIHNVYSVNKRDYLLQGRAFDKTLVKPMKSNNENLIFFAGINVFISLVMLASSSINVFKWKLYQKKTLFSKTELPKIY